MLTTTASDPDGDPLTYTWSSDLGVVAPVVDGSQAIFTADDGPATAHLTVTVSDGSLTATATAAVTVWNVAPSAGGTATPIVTAASTPETPSAAACCG